MKNSLLVHKHLIIRAEASRPPMDEEQLTEWMKEFVESIDCLLYTSPSPRDGLLSRMPSSA